jgi:hypothetical protein
MPDITMCFGTGCPKKKTCYRYTAKPSFLQSYFDEPPLKPDGSCSYSWPTSPAPPSRQLPSE